jgi:hypothetical protein
MFNEMAGGGGDKGIDMEKGDCVSRERAGWDGCIILPNESSAVRRWEWRMDAWFPISAERARSGQRSSLPSSPAISPQGWMVLLFVPRLCAHDNAALFSD